MATSFSAVCAFYDHLTLHIVPGPRSLSYFAFLLLLPGALLIPPSILSHRQLASVFFPLIVACELHAWQRSGAPDVISITMLQWSFVLLVCYDPRKNFKRVWWETEFSDGGKEVRFIKREKAYPNQSFIERLSWVLTLLVSIRLTNWEIGNMSHDMRQPTLRNVSRIAFLRHAWGMTLSCYILLDISAYHAHLDPYFTTSTIDVDASLPVNASQINVKYFQSTLSYLPPRLVRSTILACQLYGIIAGGFYPFTFPVVAFSALRLLPDEWSPHTWPRFFGAFSTIPSKGLRGLWGSWWHQMNRQMSATPGRLLADHMGFREASILRKMIVSTVAFGLSGWMHMGLIPPNPISRGMTPLGMRLSVAAFFWVQPLGFAVEYLVTTALHQRAPKLKFQRGADLLVLLWVSSWLCLTLPMLTAPFRELGYWEVYPVPYSVVNGLAGNGWWTWS